MPATILFEDRDVTQLSTAPARISASPLLPDTQVLPRFTALENVALAAQARAGLELPLLAPGCRRGAPQPTRPWHPSLWSSSAHARRAPAGTCRHGEKASTRDCHRAGASAQALLLDEPMAGAGSRSHVLCSACCEGLKRRFSMLLVEHDMEAVFALADRFSVLVAGRIIATGEPHACVPIRRCGPPISERRGIGLLTLARLEAGYGDQQVLFGFDFGRNARWRKPARTQRHGQDHQRPASDGAAADPPPVP
jgi:ABC-type branched-subunit amino acid transport system ATPase component